MCYRFIYRKSTCRFKCLIASKAQNRAGFFICLFSWSLYLGYYIYIYYLLTLFINNEVITTFEKGSLQGYKTPKVVSVVSTTTRVVILGLNSLQSVHLTDTSDSEPDFSLVMLL